MVRGSQGLIKVGLESERCLCSGRNESDVVIDAGPIFTYMAKCDPNCGSFTGTKGPVWFKIGMCLLYIGRPRRLTVVR